MAKINKKPLRMIAWEVTGACNLKCVHCRASAVDKPLPDEFSTQEALQFIDEICEFSQPIIILTGGEPLLREDIFDIACHGVQKGLRMVMGTNGTLITKDIARRISDSGIQRVAISLESSTPKIHDEFRRVPGSFEAALEGIEHLKEARVDFQIAPTITKRNLNDLENILNLAV
ncbi:MAG: radical SAM protein, partial [Actinomycetota bacterium]